MNKTRLSSSSSESKEGVKWRIFPSLAMGGGEGKVGVWKNAENTVLIP